MLSNLKNEIKKLGITQKELAKVIGVTGSRMSEIILEKNSKSFSQTTNNKEKIYDYLIQKGYKGEKEELFVSFDEDKKYDYKDTIFSKRFSELLSSKKNNLTQKELAQYLGVHYNTIVDWKNGAKPRSDRLIRIAELYGVTIDWLSGNDEIEIKDNIDYLKYMAMKEIIKQYNEPFEFLFTNKDFNPSYLFRFILKKYLLIEKEYKDNVNEEKNLRRFIINEDDLFKRKKGLSTREQNNITYRNYYLKYLLSLVKKECLYGGNVLFDEESNSYNSKEENNFDELCKDLMVNDSFINDINNNYEKYIDELYNEYQNIK